MLTRRRKHNPPWASFALFLLWVTSSLHAQCPPPSRVWKSRKLESSSCLCVPKNASVTDIMILKTPDQKDGVEVQFPISSDIFYYEVSLFVVKETNETKTCDNFDDNELMANCSRYFHSMREFFSSTCNNIIHNQEAHQPSCDLIASVGFRNVSSGCYIAIVKPQYPYMKSSKTYGVETDYKKDPIWKMAPAIGQQVHPSSSKSQGSSLRILIKDFDMLFREKLTIDLYLRDDLKCMFDPSKDANNIAAWTMFLTDEDQLVWQNQTDLPYLQNCTLDGESVICEFINMKPGNYCLGLVPDHPDQCIDSTWTYSGGNFRSCYYHHAFRILGESQDPPIVEKIYSMKGIIIVTLSVVLSGLVVIGLYFVIRSYIKVGFKPVPGHSSLATIPSQARILLLYAQDCEEFMKTVETFREFLQVVGNCEVLDCFDYSRIDVAPCPDAWMRYWASNSDVKVIVVASPCAMAHQKALPDLITLCYKEPMQYSSLFSLGFHEVMHNQQRKYWNTFIVRFDDSDLDYIMPYTRYTLPQGIPHLLKDLHVHADLDNTTNSSIMKKLESQQGVLLEHHRKQPDYVKQILFKLKENV